MLFAGQSSNLLQVDDDDGCCCCYLCCCISAEKRLQFLYPQPPECASSFVRRSLPLLLRSLLLLLALAALLLCSCVCINARQSNLNTILYLARLLTHSLAPLLLTVSHTALLCLSGQPTRFLIDNVCAISN